jgi:hypothetical protein
LALLGFIIQDEETLMRAVDEVDDDTGALSVVHTDLATIRLRKATEPARSPMGERPALPQRIRATPQRSSRRSLHWHCRRPTGKETMRSHCSTERPTWSGR